jgi:hypothetical protein
VNISCTDYNFTSNTQFRFRCDASGNNDQIYIDQVTITGNSGFSPLTTYINSLGRDINNILGNEGNEIDYESDFLLYPNPAKSNISIKLTTESNYITYHIFNMIGQEVLSGVLKNETIKKFKTALVQNYISEDELYQKINKKVIFETENYKLYKLLNEK